MEPQEGEYMRRLICRHMFHYQCWVSAVVAGPRRDVQERVATCPICRGRGHAIACWSYMDMSITTQTHPVSGTPLRNVIEDLSPTTRRSQPRIPEAVAMQLLRTPGQNTAQHYRIGTPSSDWGAASPHQSDETGFMVIHSTCTDANDWVVGQTGFGADTPAGDRQVDGSSAVPRVYHVETILPNGKPALLVDIGSVGNLVGDEWVRLQVAAALRAGLRP